MPAIEVKITDEQMEKIKGEVRADFERNWSHEKLLAFLKDTTTISLQEYLWKYGISDRYRALMGKKVEDLTDHERFICATYWMMYEAFGRR